MLEFSGVTKIIIPGQDEFTFTRGDLKDEPEEEPEDSDFWKESDLEGESESEM